MEGWIRQRISVCQSGDELFSAKGMYFYAIPHCVYEGAQCAIWARCTKGIRGYTREMSCPVPMVKLFEKNCSK